MRNSSLVLLSGEPTSIPAAEARALFLAYDPGSEFESPESRVLLVRSEADPFVVGMRTAFSRRVGRLVTDAAEAAEMVSSSSVRVRSFVIAGGGRPPDAEKVLQGLDVSVDLTNPDFELTVIEGRKRYLALTAPSKMRQGWSVRRPRRRPFFHPSAIFPKLSRALVNLSRCKEGQLFLDPFAGTGSLAIEASVVGARVVVFDRSRSMSRGSLMNMKGFGQEWLGILTCDAFRPPVSRVDAIATDVPYGRASSTGGMRTQDVVRGALEMAGELLDAGSRMVIMHPKVFPAEPGSDWSSEEEHDLYVHKRLTRTITVLRRR